MRVNKYCKSLRNVYSHIFYQNLKKGGDNLTLEGISI